MRRVALAVALIALAGCGDGDRRSGPKVTPTATTQAEDGTAEALKAVRDSSLPEDAKRELEEAAEMLEDDK